MANLVKLLNLLENSMTWNLALIAFNNRDNAAFSIAGWYIDAGIGIYNTGTINAGTGNDT
jgi:hypothetical protein